MSFDDVVDATEEDESVPGAEATVILGDDDSFAFEESEVTLGEVSIIGVSSCEHGVSSMVMKISWDRLTPSKSGKDDDEDPC